MIVATSHLVCPSYSAANLKARMVSTVIDDIVDPPLLGSRLIRRDYTRKRQHTSLSRILSIFDIL